MLNVFVAMVSLLVMGSPAYAGNNALLGALLGAGVGAGVGHAVDRTGGSGKGAVIGAIGGYVIGSQMDKRDQPNTEQAGNRTTGQRVTYDNTACGQADRYVDMAAQSSDNADRIYYLEKAVKLCPNHARAHNDLGVGYYQRDHRHDRDRARSEFNQALQIDPDYTVARNNLNRL